MDKLTISDVIIQLHDLARQQPDAVTNIAIRKLADNLAKIGNTQLDNLLNGAEIMSDKGYTESTLEKQAEFAKKRKYKDLGDCV